MKSIIYLFIAATMAVCSVTVGQVVKKKPEKPDHYFLTKLGNDTLAVEEFSINSHEIQGTSICACAAADRPKIQSNVRR